MHDTAEPASPAAMDLGMHARHRVVRAAGKVVDRCGAHDVEIIRLNLLCRDSDPSANAHTHDVRRC